ncbi:MAG: ParB/RepB/Spo0J family partition protein [Thomasclavelia sp.]|jgi:ParB family chromosome partitioning protein|nr:ParB/RepB/Spo0J family partition protein [Thomasclavelia sp.]
MKDYKVIDALKIRPNIKQPRKTFDDESIDELAKSIEINGLIQPIVVRKTNGGMYQIIAGERRYRACKQAHLSKIPCIIKDIDDDKLASLALIENIQREDLNPIEEAMAYKELLDVTGKSQEQLAAQVGKKQSTIANKLRLLKLPEEVLQEVNDKKITERHARALIGLPKPKQIETLKQIEDNNWTVAKTEKYLKEDKPVKKKVVKLATNKNVKLAVNTINQAIGMIEKAGVKINKEEIDEYDEYTIIIKVNKHD